MLFISLGITACIVVEQCQILEWKIKGDFLGFFFLYKIFNKAMASFCLLSRPLIASPFSLLSSNSFDIWPLLGAHLLPCCLSHLFRAMQQLQSGVACRTAQINQPWHSETYDILAKFKKV